MICKNRVNFVYINNLNKPISYRYKSVYQTWKLCESDSVILKVAQTWNIHADKIQTKPVKPVLKLLYKTFHGTNIQDLYVKVRMKIRVG